MAFIGIRKDQLAPLQGSMKRKARALPANLSDFNSTSPRQRMQLITRTIKKMI